ncbi:MAG: PorT family protein [Prevotella sp.]|nr:PorT family protein [Prevotella sp.]
MNRHTTGIIIVLLFCAAAAPAQEKKVQNKPYIDLRPFHFGISVGMHLQDIELMNIGTIETVDEAGNVTTSFINADQSRFDPGFNVGVTGEFRLSEFFQFRVAPTIFFGSRHIIFLNHTQSDGENTVTQTQDLKSAYIAVACDIIFAAPRVNNHRVYLMAGITPALNLTNKASDYLRLKRGQIFVEAGVGLDRYLPYFKCRPELKFMFGLGNALSSGHVDELRDETMKAYTGSITSAKTRMITLTLYFE